MSEKKKKQYISHYEHMLSKTHKNVHRKCTIRRARMDIPTCKSLVRPEEVQELSTQMHRFHDWYMKESTIVRTYFGVLI